MAKQSIIEDPLTKKKFARDIDTPGSLYEPYAPPAAAPTPAAVAPTAPVPSPIQIKRTVDPNVQKAESFLGTFKAPESAEQIAERLRQSSQGLISSINKTFDDQVIASRKVGDERLAMDNAVSVLSGLTGSTEAVRTRGKTLEANEKEIQAINNQRGLDLAKVYTQISKDAREEALKQREDATKSANDILARRTQSQTKAVENLKLMAQGGLVDFESFKRSPQNQDVYNYALDAVGGSEEALRGLFAVNRPKDQLVGTPTRIGGKYVQAYQNPLTGKVSYETLDLGFDLPTEYNNFQKVGDNLVAIPDNWDGDISKLKTIYAAPDPAKTAATAQAAQQKMETLALAKELRSDKAVGKGSAVGASAAKLVPFGQALGWQGDRTAFEAKVNSLKANLTLDNLKLLKGAMSDKDLLFLNSIGSSLDTSMSESSFNKEMDRIIEKLGGSSEGSAGNIITAPDGTEVEIID